VNIKIGDKIKMDSYEGIVSNIGNDGFTVKVYSSAIPSDLNSHIYVSSSAFMKNGYILHRANEDTG